MPDRYGMNEEEYQYGQKALKKAGFKQIQLPKEMERKIALAEKKAARDLLVKGATSKFEAAEEAAYRAGAKKKGGLLGLGIFGGHYGEKSKEDYIKAAEGAKGADVAGAADKTQAAASLTQMLTGESVGSHLGGGDTGASVDGAMSGAAMGAKFGPWGAAAGAVAGAVMGAASARAARKAQERKIEAQKQRALGEIAMEEGRQLSTALGSMGARMSASFR